MPNLFFVLGGPGCGKGTQCTLLNKKLKFLHISAGELLRKAAHLQEVSYYLNSGKIVPSQVTIRLLQQALEEHKGYSNILIDGFPRNLENLEGFIKTNIPFKGCIYISLNNDIMLQRVLGRQEARSDDNPDVFQKRINVFREETLPIIDWFKNQKKLIQIEGDGTPQEVHEKIVKKLEELASL